MDKKFIVVSVPKSGSTYFMKSLQLVRGSAILWYEPLLGWARDCRAKGTCSWAETQAALEAGYQTALDEKQRGDLVGFKVQLDQQLELRHASRFARWATCRNITVVHLQRHAALESFVTLQDEALDLVSSGTFADRNELGSNATGVLVAERPPIQLDVRIAVEYVRRIDEQHRSFRQAVQDVPGLAYYPMSYESIARDETIASRHWAALLTFLQVKQPWPDLAHATDCDLHPKHCFARVHPGNCRSKIANWRELRHALYVDRLDSFWACDWRAAP
jgi:hypothetical protein